MKAFLWIAGGVVLLSIIAATNGPKGSSTQGFSPSVPVVAYPNQSSYQQPRYYQPPPPARLGNNHPLAPGWTPQQMPRNRHGIPVLTPEHRRVENQWLRTQPAHIRQQFRQADRLIEETNRLLDATGGY